MASFTLRASSNAAGTFTISANTTGTLLRDADAAAIGWEPGAVAEVIVE